MKKLIVIICALIFNSCITSVDNRVVGNYCVSNIGDSSVEWLIYSTGNDCSGEGIIAGINKVGFDSKFIIVEAGIQEFYIVEYSRNKNQYFDKQYLIGPLNKGQFDLKKNELKIVDLNFTQSF